MFMGSDSELRMPPSLFKIGNTVTSEKRFKCIDYERKKGMREKRITVWGRRRGQSVAMPGRRE